MKFWIRFICYSSLGNSQIFVPWKSYSMVAVLQLNSFSYYSVLDQEERNGQGKG
jgi:hypothetical protein